MKQFFSFSEAKLWRQDKAEYIRRYVLGQETPINSQQRLGKIVHSALEDPRYPWLKEMKDDYPRRLQTNVRTVLNKMMARGLPPGREVTVTAKTKYGLTLLGIFDGLDKKQRMLRDYKTYTGTDEAWSPWIVDNHQQFSFYAWIWKLTYHSYFSDIEIDVMNLDRAAIRAYHTIRSLRDIENVESWANQIVSEMKHEKVWDKRLSTKERLKLNTQPTLLNS